jgi:hypothetical protein
MLYWLLFDAIRHVFYATLGLNVVQITLTRILLRPAENVANILSPRRSLACSPQMNNRGGELGRGSHHCNAGAKFDFIYDRSGLDPYLRGKTSRRNGAEVGAELMTRKMAR